MGGGILRVVCACVRALQRCWFLMAEDEADSSNSKLVETDSAAAGGKEE